MLPSWPNAKVSGAGTASAGLPGLRTRFGAARRAAAEQSGDDALAERIRLFQFRDIRPKAASELPVEHASRLLGHSEKEITERVYRRIGEVVKPTK